MKLYKLTFNSLSSISKLPDAQTIFGAVCRIISFTQGEDVLERYITSFNTNNPLFVHSSMFIDTLLPMPKVGLISIDEKNKNMSSLSEKEQLSYLSHLKGYKKIRYISYDVYKDYIVDSRFNDLRKDIESNKLKIENGIVSKTNADYQLADQLVYHTNKETNVDEDRLYYDNNQYFPDDTKFTIYVKTDDIKFVKSVFQYSQYFGFGSRVSVGKNCFELVDVDMIQYPKSNNEVLLLSKCIDTTFDLEESSYTLSSETYKGSYYYSSNTIGHFNKFEEGSFMRITENKEYYGRLIEADNGKKIYHYAIGFVI